MLRAEISHVTLFRFAEAARYSIHDLRLAPRPAIGQRVAAWRVRAAGRRGEWTDGYGNGVTTVSVVKPHQELEITVEGVYESAIPDSWQRFEEPEPLPPAYWLRPTPATRATPEIAALGADLAAGAAEDAARVDVLHEIMRRVHGRMEFRPGELEVGAAASDALARGVGASQDHAHLVIAVCRSLGIPARYVSGYRRRTAGAQVGAASHAWAEAHAGEAGWIGFDAVNEVCPTDDYLKLAVGLDWREAAPITGRRSGGGPAAMDVKATIVERDEPAAEE